ncbi:unnamed protein product [Polarella glacialis]|uniref:Ribonucleotide reductase large subunit C-terminal domain-containing protein n=1 Tax=Polarella glacialis TaxID=89957 RepID=A0A813H5W2_POLGL|nr:unnamed protein product [Polarella glacialis]
METGTPYMLYKDHANGKSNQQNLGTIHCSNLCTEIIEYTCPEEARLPKTPSYNNQTTLRITTNQQRNNHQTAMLFIMVSGSPEEVAVCNLASIALPAFASNEGKPYDFQRLYEAGCVIFLFWAV